MTKVEVFKTITEKSVKCWEDPQDELDKDDKKKCEHAAKILRQLK